MKSLQFDMNLKKGCAPLVLVVHTSVHHLFVKLMLNSKAKTVQIDLDSREPGNDFSI